jgi:S-adenosylmethionine decarboxylase
MSYPYLSLVGGHKAPIGKHLMFRISNMKKECLEIQENVRKHIWDIANKCEVNVVAESGYQFKPVGVTYVLVLAESHLSIHTYPEHREAYIDLFCCNMEFNEQKALDAIKTVYEGADVDIFTVIR